MNDCSAYHFYHHLLDFLFSFPGNGVLLYYFLVKSSYWSRLSQSQKTGGLWICNSGIYTEAVIAA